MINKTTALMFQTMLMFVRDNQTMEPIRLPSNFQPDAEMEKCYGVYGCFSIMEPWVTDTRPVNLFPIPADKINVRYPVFTRRNLKIPLIIDPNDITKIKHANIDSRGPFYMISHGYMESGDKIWIQKMAEALLLQEGHASSTVFVVDWRGGSNPPYTQAVANIRLVGAITARLIHTIYVQLGLSHLDNFHFIGHSLGSHLGGYTGHTLQKEFGLLLGRITGLDPAEPHFAKTKNIVRLDSSDAKYVDIIHSDATPFVSGGFGISESLGHVDFFPNGGSNQPGCNEGVFNSIQSEHGSFVRGMRKFIGCNHIRSHEYFTESIAPSCPFMAIHCQSYESFLQGACLKCGKNGHHCLPLGFHSQRGYNQLLAHGAVSPHNSLNMYSITGDCKPFCRVHYRVTFNISESVESETHGGEVGRLWIIFINTHGNKTEKIPLDEEGGKYHKPGSQKSLIVAAKGSGAPPRSAILEWEYETNLLNPLTWRILSAPRIYVSWLHIESLEYNTSIDACPQHNTPVVANMANHFQQQNCRK